MTDSHSISTDPATARSSASTARPSWLERCGGFFFRYRNAVFPVLLVPLLIGLGPTFAFGSERGDYLVDAIGFLIGLSGQVLRGLVVGYAYIKRGGKKKKVYADTLVTTGFFNHCRNPLYVGNLLVLLGFVVIHNNPWLYLVTVPFFLFAYIAIVAAEEAYLTAKFGQQYRDYCQRVPRWWIDPRGLGTTMAGMRFHWARLMVKEYGTIAVFFGTTLLLLVYETLTHHSYAQRAVYLDVLLVLLGLVVLGWAVARYLKKSGRVTG